MNTVRTIGTSGTIGTPGAIGIAGAGSIGCFVGGMLAAADRRVALLARPRVIGEIETGGLRLTSFEGADRTLAAGRLALSDDPSILGDAGVVLVTVKSADTADMADIIARHARPDAVVVSLQNGIGNAAVLRNRLPGRRVLGGMVPFNVVAAGQGRFIAPRRATSSSNRMRRIPGQIVGARPENASNRQH